MSQNHITHLKPTELLRTAGTFAGCNSGLRASTRALQHAPQDVKPAARSQSTQDVPPMERFVTAVQTQPWHESSSVSKSHCTGHTGQGRDSRVTLPLLEHLPGSGKASSSHGVPPAKPNTHAGLACSYRDKRFQGLSLTDLFGVQVLQFFPHQLSLNLFC